MFITLSIVYIQISNTARISEYFTYVAANPVRMNVSLMFIFSGNF